MLPRETMEEVRERLVGLRGRWRGLWRWLPLLSSPPPSFFLEVAVTILPTPSFFFEVAAAVVILTTPLPFFPSFCAHPFFSFTFLFLRLGVLPFPHIEGRPLYFCFS
ncbi:hypothetical protein BC829DRAFT_382178, partial [Chytridium lagenaria]